MKHFTSSLLFALTILSGTASFAQSQIPAENNKVVPASTDSEFSGHTGIGTFAIWVRPKVPVPSADHKTLIGQDVFRR